VHRGCVGAGATTTGANTAIRRRVVARKLVMEKKTLAVAERSSVAREVGDEEAEEVPERTGLLDAFPILLAS
jgi:hypothetical protein